MNGVQLLLIIFAGVAVAAVTHRRGVQPGLVVVVLAAAASFMRVCRGCTSTAN